MGPKKWVTDKRKDIKKSKTMNRYFLSEFRYGLKVSGMC